MRGSRDLVHRMLQGLNPRVMRYMYIAEAIGSNGYTALSRYLVVHRKVIWPRNGMRRLRVPITHIGDEETEHPLCSRHYLNFQSKAGEHSSSNRTEVLSSMIS